LTKRKHKSKPVPAGQHKSKPAAFKTSHKILIGIILVGFLLLLILPNLLNNKENNNYYSFTKEGELTFYDSSNVKKVTIDIEVAATDYERQLGLMNREGMGDKQGMLFIFPVEEYQSFWMRNCLFSQDMIFVNADKKIVTIHKNTKVLSDQSYPSSVPAQYVVEVNAGFTDRYNIKEGDKVSW
jgi:uncharacterized membrane protein (UPF0127 family)